MMCLTSISETDTADVLIYDLFWTGGEEEVCECVTAAGFLK